MSRYHNNSFAGDFRIDKIRKLVAKKYFWPMIYSDTEAYA